MKDAFYLQIPIFYKFLNVLPLDFFLTVSTSNL